MMNYDELVNAKQNIEDLERKMPKLRGDGKKEHKELKNMLNAGIKYKDKRSYSEVMKKNKKENIIFVKFCAEQNSEDIEKIIKEKVIKDIKKMSKESLEIQERHQHYDHLRM